MARFDVDRDRDLCAIFAREVLDYTLHDLGEGADRIIGWDDNAAVEPLGCFDWAADRTTGAGCFDSTSFSDSATAGQPRTVETPIAKRGIPPTRSAGVHVDGPEVCEAG
jgi:hypothetical protein